jgi:GAF domain-containing protein
VADVSGALQAVSEAVLGIAGELSVDAVLERLVRTARDLVHARYAALGTPDDEGGFARFITAGMTDAEIEAMGPLPRTHGLLGAMLSGTAPFRTEDITADPRFRGWWPSTHPHMRSFLGVPIVF